MQLTSAPTSHAILIAGPTASGKSALAISAAKHLNGVVINADSMQVYRDLRILSARPDATEEREAEHKLYGFVEAGTEYSVGDYLRDAAKILDQVRSQDKTPIFVGGTGLYFKALTQGLIETPDIPPEIRTRLYEEAGAGVDLHARLQLRDPTAAARFSTNDQLRIIRALEVVEGTGRTISEWQQGANSAPILPPGSWQGIFMTLPREVLKDRIHRRFEVMVEAGALDEVKALMALGLPANRGIMKAHGVPHLAAHLRGELALADAIALGQMDTRRYAKRQHTFARGQLLGFEFVEADMAEGWFSGLS